MLDLTTPTPPPPPPPSPPPATATSSHAAPAPARPTRYFEVDTDYAMTPVPDPPAPGLASASDFPDDHWEEPTSDHLGSPAPQEVEPQASTPVDAGKGSASSGGRHTPAPSSRPSPIPFPTQPSTDPPPAIAPAALPLPPLEPPSSEEQPTHTQGPVTMQDVEAMIADIRRDMEAIRVEDRRQQDRNEERFTTQAKVNVRLEESIDSRREEIVLLREETKKQMEKQWAFLTEMGSQVSGVLTFLRESRAGGSSTTPPAFNPPPAFTGPLPFTDMGESVSTFARRVTNDVFTPNVSPVARRVQPPTTPTRAPANSPSGAPASIHTPSSPGMVAGSSSATVERPAKRIR